MAKVVAFAEDCSPTSDRVALRPAHADSATWSVEGMSPDRSSVAPSRCESRPSCYTHLIPLILTVDSAACSALPCLPFLHCRDAHRANDGRPSYVSGHQSKKVPIIAPPLHPN